MHEQQQPADPGTAQRLEACVRGRVQGVGFRAFVRHQAQRLGVHGAVWNGEDGVVYVVAEGARPALDALVTALHQGPHGARPTGVETHWMPATGRAPAPFQVAG